MWRIDGDTPRRLHPSPMPLESMLEDYLAHDPSLLGDQLLIIGRQIRTPHGKFIDLLAVDVDGNLRVLELKRDQTPREVVAQLLDYGSWVSTLDREEVLTRAGEYLGRPFETAFGEAFDAPVPDELNTDLQLTVVASVLDPSSERIITYLREFGVPINAVFFRFLQDGDRQYLARSWLADDDTAEVNAGARPKSRTASWNGVDWYANFGDGESRSWEDGRQWGFISAGGGAFYSSTLRKVPVGARVNVYLPQRGYVAIGTTLAPASRFNETEVHVDGRTRPLAEVATRASYRHTPGSEPESDEIAEYAIPVRWFTAVPADQAYREPGMFASQHSACKLRQDFTLQKLSEHFGLADEDT